jgi:hypothetical protein
MTDTELDFIRKLNDAGISFIISPVFGLVELEVEDVPVFLDDPDAFMARGWGVSVEQFRAWRDFARNPHCQATTKKNTPCTIAVPTPPQPAQFKPGISDYCRIHQEHI